jgi:hypothetical protein
VAKHPNVWKKSEKEERYQRMKYALRLTVICSLLLVFSAWNPLQAQPVDLDTRLLKQFQLSGRPIDIAASEDGKLFFVLTPGEVAVYSNFAEKPFKQISVDDGFDRMIYSEKTSTLILTNAATHTMKILGIDPIQNISIEGSPFKGPENAPVVLAVFDDYQ